MFYVQNALEFLTYKNKYTTDFAVCEYMNCTKAAKALNITQ